MGPITLTIVEGDDAGRELEVSGPVRIGRDPNAEIVLSDSEVSSLHATLVPGDGGILVRDLGSTNGTFVNGQRLVGTQPLKHGDHVQLGATVLEVRSPPPPPPPPPPAPPEPQPSPPATAESADLTTWVPPNVQATRARRIPTIPVLNFVAGSIAGTEIRVAGPVVIGRDYGAADVILEDDGEVSRRHATFAPSGAGVTVQDLESTNGTYVNGQRITGTASLKSGDRIEIGNSVIEIRISGETIIDPPTPAEVAAPAAAARTNSIEVEGLVRTFGDYRAVDGISLHVNPGEIYGFLGPNGAGKSTTVHMLVTLLPPTAGVARVAGYNVAIEGVRVRSVIGVALQEAALDSNLNACEHMALQTALQGIPRSERKRRGDELIERVGLSYAANQRVGSYSGGMKRRLDLALALVHEPQVLFLDEPTTGLDPQSRTALWEEVARLVKEEGMTVFLTTQYLEEADMLADRVGIIDHGEIVAEDTPARLKAEIGRPTVEVVPVDLDTWGAVSSALEQFGELTSARSKGVAVRLAPAVEGLADVIRALDSRGLRVSNVELHAPTLDDVFLLKTGRSLEGAGEAGEAGESGTGGEAADGGGRGRGRRGRGRGRRGRGDVGDRAEAS